MKQVIYETKGRAREFNELAINLFRGCGHRCVYCYGADVTHRDRAKFQNEPRPRVTVTEIENDAERWARLGEKRPVLLCFVCDPYQPIEAVTQITRKAILLLHSYGLNVIILTKGGFRSLRDFDLLTPKDAYATTLTLLHTDDSLKWEPGAAPPDERVYCLKEAHRRGIPTWVSLEPVIDPGTAKEIVKLTHKVAGHYKVGPINYVEKLPPDFRKQVEGIDWPKFGREIKELLDRLGARYYFKKDLLARMG